MNTTTIICQFCGLELEQDDDDVWHDDSPEGDVCAGDDDGVNWNQPHVPSKLGEQS